MRWIAVLFLSVLAIAELNTVGANEPVYPLSQDLPMSVHPVPPQQPPVTYTVPAIVSDKKNNTNRVAHLRKAAEHLQAAGLNSLANHIRELAYNPNVAKPTTQILFHVELLELDKKNLNRLDLDLSRARLLLGTSEFKDRLKTLRNEGLVRVFAEPTLVTPSGKPAQFHVGGEVLLWSISPDGKPVQRPEEYGTRLDLLAILIGNGRIRFEIRFEYSQLDQTKTVLVAGKKNPALKKRTMETGLEMKLGETVILSGLEESADSTSKVTLMVVTAETIEPMATRYPVTH